MYPKLLEDREASKAQLGRSRLEAFEVWTDVVEPDGSSDAKVVSFRQ